MSLAVWHFGWFSKIQSQISNKWWNLFCGLSILDSYNYNVPPCYNTEGTGIDELLQMKSKKRYKELVQGWVYNIYFSETTIYIHQTNDQWGSCHNEYDEGHIIGLEINIFHQRLTIILKCGEMIQVKDIPQSLVDRSDIAGIVFTWIDQHNRQ